MRLSLHGMAMFFIGLLTVFAVAALAGCRTEGRFTEQVQRPPAVRCMAAYST
jgi:hypothetical protein